MIDERIEKIVKRIIENFDPQKIVLFGSYARGTQTENSDVDLLIVMPVSGSKRDKVIEVRIVLHDIRIAKDVIVVTPEEAEGYKDVVGTIIGPALKEGKVLYERAA